MAQRTQRIHKMWTKEEIKKLVEDYKVGKTISQIAVELNRSTPTVQDMISRIRKSGYDLPKQSHKGKKLAYLHDLLAETLKEL